MTPRIWIRQKYLCIGREKNFLGLSGLQPNWRRCKSPRMSLDKITNSLFKSKRMQTAWRVHVSGFVKLNLLSQARTVGNTQRKHWLSTSESFRLVLWKGEDSVLCQCYYQGAGSGDLVTSGQPVERNPASQLEEFLGGVLSLLPWPSLLALRGAVFSLTQAGAGHCFP